MLATAAFTDLKNYIKRRLAYGRYQVGSTYTRAELSDVSILSDGTVRAQLVITADTTPITITKVELYNNNAELWASQSCSITVNTGQTGVLYWFDFTIKEEEA
ncbi:MAG: hypothetical protein LUD25_02405 [Coriobacteriaceae bacterium]|nr:hypothetical protein [Coriobacteriaceae bacterium]